MNEYRPGDEIWIDGFLKEPSKEGRLLFSPCFDPDAVINISCSYPGEDYRGVDPLEPSPSGKSCQVRGVVSLVRANSIVLEVWDDFASGGAGRLSMPLGEPCFGA